MDLILSAGKLIGKQFKLFVVQCFLCSSGAFARLLLVFEIFKFNKSTKDGYWLYNMHIRENVELHKSFPYMCIKIYQVQKKVVLKTDYNN